MTKPKIRLGLVDYSPDFLHSFSYCLLTHDYTISIPIRALTGSIFIKKFKSLKPDPIPNIVAIDTEIPFNDGIHTIQWVKSHYPEIRIVAFTNKENPDIKKLLSQLKIKTYLIKTFWAGDMVKLFNRLLSLSNDNDLVIVR